MRNQSSGLSVGKTVETVLPSLAVGLAVTAVLLMASALLMTVRDLPDGMISPLAIAALGIGCLAAGWLSARRAGKRGLLMGAVTGLGLFLLMFVIGWIAIGTPKPGFAAFKLAVTVLCGGIGGVLGVGSRHR